MRIVFMTTRRWIGVATLLIAVVIGIGLQARSESLFQVTFRGPQVEKTNDATFEWSEFSLSPHWSIAAPLTIMAILGLALLVLPEGMTLKRRRR